MKNMIKGMLNKLKDKKGATAVEYAMMVALIAAVVILSVTTLGSNTKSVFDFVKDKIIVPGT